jgi:hypothetical protein
MMPVSPQSHAYKAKPVPKAPSRGRSWWKTIDRALEAGQAPRSVVRRYAELNRKALTRHRDGCLAATFATKSGMMSGRSTRRKA